MILRVLDKKEIGQNKGCVLCAAPLDKYLANIGEDFDKYDIQRNIVSNPYLDDIANTVFGRKHIPVISLVVEGELICGSDEEIVVDSFRILDGLQRTWRLKTLKGFVEWLMMNYPTLNELKEKFCDVSIRMIPVEDRKAILELGMTDLKRAKEIAKQIIDLGSYEVATDSFSDNKQWFEVWYGLDQDEIIKEMLLLNAGHKPMSAKHQVELLYLNWLEVFSSVSRVKIRRDKDIKSSVKFVIERDIREYRFSDLVMSTLAFANGRVNDIQTMIVMKSFESIDEAPVPASKEYYTGIISFIADMDTAISEHFSIRGKEWFGRANIMEAFCAAAGAWIKELGEGENQTESLKRLAERIEDNIGGLELEEFDVAKNKLDATKVNIGQRMKKVVFQAIFEFLHECKRIEWDRHFSLQ